MVDHAAAQQSSTKRLQSFLDAAKKAFDPARAESLRQEGQREYDALVERTETWVLIPILNALVKPGTLPGWMRQHLMQTLITLPLRKDGVRGTMEFVFSVHPSNRSQEQAEPHKEGAGITHEAVALATQLLSAVPSGLAAEEWFNGIACQLFALIDGEAGPDLSKIAAQVVGFGILGRKEFGAPGSAGWNVFVQPLLETVNPSVRVDRDQGKGSVASDAEVVDLTTDRILVEPATLSRSIQRLQTLILSNPSPGLCRRVLKPILLQLWSLGSWCNAPQQTEEKICGPSRRLLQTYIRIFGNVESVMPFMRDLLCRGSSPNDRLRWEFRLLGQDGVVVMIKAAAAQVREELDWNHVEMKAMRLVDMITQSCPREELSSIFLYLLRRWILAAQSRGKVTVKIKTSTEAADSISPEQELVEVTVLQKLLDKAPDKLVAHFDQLLDLICQVLKVDATSRLDDDLVGVVLSLLNLAITSPTFQISDIHADALPILETSLQRIRKEDRGDVSWTAGNLERLVSYHAETESPNAATCPSSRRVEDRQTYDLALNYMTGVDNPPPVVSEGLDLLSTLIVGGSPALDITTILVLMSNMLRNSEDYINLRVIKVFTQLAIKHPRSTMQELLDEYLDAEEKLSTDIRLRFGEALLQVMERLGETFAGDVARQATETLLSISGRRGYRPKTMAQQARDQMVRERKRERSEGEDEPEEDTAGDGEQVTGQEKSNDDIIRRIVQGWDSKRGSEDVRMRTSALSILGSAIEINVAGMGPSLVSAAVDVCANVLTLEPEREKGILRRAAVLAILSFVKALDTARSSGRSLGFGLTDQSRLEITTTLQYVADTDNDGLVRQHARDVVESLGNWQLGAFLPGEDRSNSGTSGELKLAGLKVKPGGSAGSAADGSRPRIEEVE